MARDRKRPIWRRFPVATPAAGAEWTLRNDRGGIWLLRALTWRLVTDATVATRRVGLRVTAGEDAWFRTTGGATQVASLTRIYQVWPGSPAGADNTLVNLVAWPIEGLWVPSGHVVTSDTANMQAGDQLDAVLVDLVEYPETIPANLVPSITLYEDSESE